MKKILMNPKGLWILLATLAVGLAGCKDDEPEIPTVPSINILYGGATATNLSLDYDDAGAIKPAAANSYFEVESTRSWAMTKVPADATWLTVTPVTGSVGTTKVTVSVTANDGEIRSATLTFKTTDGTNIEKKVVINQDGDLPVVDHMPIADFRRDYLSLIAAGTQDGSGNPSIPLDKEIVFMGTVVSDGAGKNIEDYLFALQDNDAINSGIIINLTGHGLAAGEIVSVTCAAGNKAMLYNNLLQVNATSIVKYGSSPREPVTATIDNMRSYESQLVKIENVQLKTNETTTWSGSKVFVNTDYATLTSYVKSGAVFSGQNIPTGSGYLVGISGVFGTTTQIQPRNANDGAGLDQTRFPDAPVAQEGANILLQENMGSTSAGGNISVNAWNTTAKPSGFQKEGLGAGNVKYSTPTATGTNDASVRITSPSAGYTKASGLNSVFFTSSTTVTTTPTFLIEDIALGGTNELYLGFGLQTLSSNMTVSYREDGGVWKPLTLTTKSDGWDYFVTPFTVTQGTELLALRFVATQIPNGFRIDDIYVTTDQTYTQSHIPDVTTGSSAVTGQSVTLNGSYTYSGTATDITECGFAYGTSEATMTTVTATAGATFSQTVSSLPAGIYSWYAYVKKGTTTYVGDTESFTIQPAVMTTVSISSLVSGWTAGGTVEVGKQIVGTIVTDRTGANYSSVGSSFAIVDGTGQNSGILVYQLKQEDGTTNATHTFNAGDQVIVNVGGAKMTTFNGLRELEGIKLSAVTADTSGGTAYTSPVTVSSAADLANYQSMLVSIASSPATAAINTTWSGSKTFEDSSSAQFTVYTASAASFATSTIPAGSGTVAGVVGYYNAVQLMPRNLTDINLSTPVSYFSVSTQTVPVAATGGNATVDVTANVNWTAAVTAGAANITSGPTPVSGNTNQTITLVFPANTDTENTKSVTLRVSATGSGLTPDYYDVVFIQEKAAATGTSVETFSSFASTNNSYTSAAAAGTYNSTEVSGLVWSYAGTAHNQGGAKFVIGRYSSGNTNAGSLTTSTISTGVGSISIDWRVPFNDSSTGISFKVFVNDVEKGTFTLIPAETTSGKTGTYTIDNINVSGNAVIKIESNVTGRPGVNAVQWTAYP